MSDLILGTNRETNEVISVSTIVRESGMVLFGTQGSGKSSLIESMVYQDAMNNRSIFVIDPHYDLINNIIAQLPLHRLKDTYLLDLTDTEYPFAVNVMDGTGLTDLTQAVDRVLSVFKKIFPSESEQRLLTKVLKMISYLLLSNPGMTIADIPPVLRKEAIRDALVDQVSNHYVKDYWIEEYNEMSAAKQKTEAYALNNRLPDLLTNPILEHIISQKHSSIDFRKSIDNNEIILIRLPVDEYPETAQIVGTMLIAEMYRALFSYNDTPRKDRPGVSVYIDEFQEFVSEDIGRMFTNLRKFRCKLCVATQYRDKIKGDNKNAIMTANTIVVLRATPDDAKTFAPLYYDKDKKPRIKLEKRDIFGKMKNHESDLIYDFYTTTVSPLLEDSGGYIYAQKSIDALTALLLVSQQEQRISEGLLETFCDAYASYSNRLRYMPPPSPYTSPGGYVPTEKEMRAYMNMQGKEKQQELERLRRVTSRSQWYFDTWEEQQRQREEYWKKKERYFRRIVQEIITHPIGTVIKENSVSDLANELEKLPKRCGFVTIAQEEGTPLIAKLYTADRPQPLGNSEEKFERIRAQTRKKYGTLISQQINKSTKVKEDKPKKQAFALFGEVEEG